MFQFPMGSGRSSHLAGVMSRLPSRSRLDSIAVMGDPQKLPLSSGLDRHSAPGTVTGGTSVALLFESCSTAHSV